MRTQHQSWEGIVPCFESGQEYLDWIQNWMEWEGKVPEEYADYFREVGNAVRHQGYERPISEKKMCRALERSQRTGEMIDIVPDPEFLPAFGKTILHLSDYRNRRNQPAQGDLEGDVRKYM